MSILINAIPLDTTSRYRGIGTYVRGLLDGLSALADPSVSVRLVRARSKSALEEDAFDSLRVRRMGPEKLIFLQNLLLPWEIRGTDVSVYHAPQPEYTVFSSRFRTVVTVHDLIPALFSAYSPSALYFWHQRRAARADAIIVPSECTREDLMRVLGVPAERIHVIHEAYDEGRYNLRAAAEAPGPDGLPGRYFLYLGAADYRKNLRVTIESYARAAGEVPEQLVLAGHKSDTERAAIDAWASEFGVRDRVIDLGYVPGDQLPALLGRATALLFLSRYEGFGLPALEAMACGCPVVAADAASLPEVAGEAALYAGPDDVETAAAHLRTLSGDEGVRARMVDAGLRRCQDFSWARMAEETIRVYRNVAGTG